MPRLAARRLRGQAARWAARLRDHAKCTAIAAALLNLQVGTRLRARHELRILNEGVGEAIVGPDGSSVLGARVKERSYGHNGGRKCCGCAIRETVREIVCRIVSQIEDDVRREGLVAVADDGGHASYARKLLRSALRVAAGDDNFGSGISAMRAADERTSRAIGFGRYAAGIDYDHVGRKWVGARANSRRWPAMASPSARAARQPKFSM